MIFFANDFNCKIIDPLVVFRVDVRKHKLQILTWKIKVSVTKELDL